MHSKRCAMAWIVSLFLIAPGLAFAERQGTLIGKVLDPDGKPIRGVTVTVTSPQIPKFQDVETTDKRGMFTVGFDQIDVTYHYRFDMTGYQSLEVNQEWHLVGTQFFEWTMHPGAPVVVGGAVPASTSAPAVDAFNLGVAAFKAKDYATAETKFSEAVTHDPKLRQAWEALTAVQLQLGHDKEAAEAAEKAIALGSTEEPVLTARWQAYRNLKDEAKAAEALKDLERIGRATAEAKRIHNEGAALLKAGDDAGAAAKFQEALDIDPNLQPSLLGLATADLKLGRNADAATAAETVLKADPKNEQAIRLRYNACLALGDKTRLIDALVGLAPVEPVLARDGILRLAFDAYDANDMALAKERFDKALAIDPNYPQAYYFLALIDVGDGATAEAKVHLERFLQLAPNDKEANSAREMLKYLNKKS
ncbi:MAG: tetratricopeptide repeat protein [Thermoanaerobaculaceae bacterium]|nr:tetratricopeptide repeat protein [Thermoanaerobaculaceae bacterium]